MIRTDLRLFSPVISYLSCGEHDALLPRIIHTSLSRLRILDILQGTRHGRRWSPQKQEKRTSIRADSAFILASHSFHVCGVGKKDKRRPSSSHYRIIIQTPFLILTGRTHPNNHETQFPTWGVTGVAPFPSNPSRATIQGHG